MSGFFASIRLLYKNTLLTMVPSKGAKHEPITTAYDLIAQQMVNLKNENQALLKQVDGLASEVIRQSLLLLASGAHHSDAFFADPLGDYTARTAINGCFAGLLFALIDPADLSLIALKPGQLLGDLLSFIEEIPLPDDIRFMCNVVDVRLFAVFSSNLTEPCSSIKFAMESFRYELRGRAKELSYASDSGVSGVFTSLSDIHIAYQSALTSLEQPSLEQSERALFQGKSLRIADAAIKNRSYSPDHITLLCNDIIEHSDDDEKRVHLFELVIDCFLEQLIAIRLPPDDQLIISAKPQSTLPLEAMRTHTEAFCLSTAAFLNSFGKKSKYKYREMAVSFVEDHFSDSNLDLGQAANYVGLSSTYFSKLFKESEGQSFLDFLNAYRIARAKETLRSTELSVKDIAYKCGFGSPQTFIRVFKRYTAQTPREYRLGW